MATVSQLHVNGETRRIQADAERSLLFVLRNDLDLIGSKYGCGEGKCGACTVLVDGQPMRSCITSVGDVQEKKITTIEGLEHNGRLHPLQEAFIEADAMQCGYCTPGMILSAVALLHKQAAPSEADIVRAMRGNICRCCTYSRIVTAVEKASGAMKAVHND